MKATAKKASKPKISADGQYIGAKLDKLIELLQQRPNVSVSITGAGGGGGADIYHHPKLLQAEDGSWYTLQWSETLNGRFTYADAIKACKALKFGGYSDWRLPERFELESLIDIKRRNPASSAPGMKADWYWSADPLVSADASSPSGYAWVVHFYCGGVHWDGQGDYGLVRACRRVPARQ